MKSNGLSTFFLIGSFFAMSFSSLAESVQIKPSARYRVQKIDDEGRGDARASTLKLRLSTSWQVNDYFQSFIQVDYVHAFNEKTYNSVTVNRATSPIPDVPGEELNQAWLRFVSDGNWHIKVGRQQLSLHNQRQISSVEFWQNDQTFDAITFVFNDATYWDVSYTYFNRVHRIFGDDAKRMLTNTDVRFSNNPNRPVLELGNHEHSSHLFNAKYTVNRYVDVAAYAYLLDNQSAKQLASNTVGMRVQGEIKPAKIKYAYSAEFARQKSAKDSPWNYNGYYAFVQIGAQYKSHQLAFSHERLGEHNGLAFATSLGNNHQFLGWADIFSSYLNIDGLRDTYITYKGRKAKLRWQVVGHHFEADSNGNTVGKELDIEVSYRFTRDWELTLLHSMYFTQGGIEGLSASQNDLTSSTLSLSYQF